MRYLGDLRAWLMDPRADGDAEVLISGNTEKPSLACAQVGDRALNELASLTQRAQTYLEEFVRSESLSPLNQLHLESLECGCGESTREDQASLVFSHPQDEYGEWSVTFQLSGHQFYPVAFKRRQV